MEIRDRIVGLKRVKASDLVPNPRNWRTHPKAQQDALRGILAEIGYADALLARKLPDGRLGLIDGHLRADTTPEVMVPVLVVDVTEDEAQKLLLSLDPMAGMAEANKEALASLLAELDTKSPALQAMFDDLAKQWGANGNGDGLVDVEAKLDQAEELQKYWQTEIGQVWEVPGKAGTHRVVCGDATSKADVDKVLAGAKPFIMVTDPPYGVEYDPNWRNEAAAKGQLAYAASRVGKVSHDDRADWSDAWRLFPGDVAYTWSPGGDHVIITGAVLQAAGFQIRNQIIWRKPHFPISRGHYRYQHEPCWYAVRKGRTSHWVGDHNASTVWELSLDKNVGGGHSTQKPMECMARPIRNHGGKDDDVYDPFLGSGTTLIAAEQLGRVCYGLEIEAKYVAVVLQRCKDFGLEPRQAG